ncbi:MAG TPA: type VI secretion system baseplate subunit TssF [Pirellulaceae bacterium]|nr:type VI secretion system baseplate subunit TssF [Pirellulaceae bacterium]
MDPRLLDFYNRELQHLRDVGGEFAREFPKIAGRLALTDIDCADPYVERLLEGFAFLAARVQLQIHAEFPRFCEQLLQVVYPQYLSPIPSMSVVHFAPTLESGELVPGFTIPRGATLRALLGKNEQTACEYRTSQPVTLWPLQITQAEYFTRELASMDLPAITGTKAALRLRLKVAAGVKFSQLPLDRLPLYLSGGNEFSFLLYEQLMSSTLAVAVRGVGRGGSTTVLPKPGLAPLGFDDAEALLPTSSAAFQGYRLLLEYFAFPERFLFVELQNLRAALAKIEQPEIDIFILLKQNDRRLENALDVNDFALHCAPAINLFSKRADRLHLDETQFEHHVVVDRTRPMDFEVYDIEEVVGYRAGADDAQQFLPFYATRDTGHSLDQEAFYTLRRLPRRASERQKNRGPRSTYVGSEGFLTLVDASEAPYRKSTQQLAVRALVTNRDLPLHMPVGVGTTDFTLASSAPVASIRNVAGPTRPKPSLCAGEGEFVWRLISHLSLNYLSLCNNDDRQGAAALRELLSLYGPLSEPHVRKQIDGLRSIVTKPIVRRIPHQRRAAFGRGLEATLEFDESTFPGGVYLLGAVLERFLAKYVSINSFTETVLRTASRGEIMRWPARNGLRQLL